MRERGAPVGLGCNPWFSEGCLRDRLMGGEGIGRGRRKDRSGLARGGGEAAFRFCVWLQPDFWILPAEMHEVQTRTRLRVPFSVTIRAD